MMADKRREEEVDLLDYWQVAAKHKKLIGVITSIAFAASIMAGLLLPTLYAATASVMPPQQDDLMGSAIASKLPSGLSGLAGGLLGTNSPSDLWVGILKSRTVRDGIIEKFNLRERYGKDTLEETRKKLAKRVSVEESKEEIVTVTVEDEDPSTAAEMANALIEELDKINKGAVMTSGQRMRAFVEKRLVESKEDLSRIERDLKSFQERNKAVKLDDQSKAIIEALGSVKGQLMAKEVELDILLSYAAPTNPQVQLLKAEVEGLQNKLDELEGGKKGNPGGSSNIFIPTDRIPDLSFQYVRLFRDAKVQETLFELLTQQYEMARIQEAKDSPTVQVLDYATPPDKKSRPKRALIAAFSTISGFFFSLFMAFFVEYLNRIRTEA